MVQGIMSLGATQPQSEGIPSDAANALGQGLNGLDPQEIAQLRELQDDLVELSPDKLKVLEQIIVFLKKNSERYDDAVKMLVGKGVIEPGDLPPDYVPAFFSILEDMVTKALSGNTRKFSDGGINSIEMPQSLKELQSWKKRHSSKKRPSPDDYFTDMQSGVEGSPPVAMPSSLKELESYNSASKGSLRDKANAVRKAGTGGDKVLAHINPREAAMLQATRGGGMNPDTGLPEYGFFDDIGNFLKKAAPVVLPVALGFMGVPPIIAGAVGSGVGAMINGAKPQDALGAALMGGIGGAVFSGVSNMGQPGGFMGGVSQGFKPATQGMFSDAFGGYSTPVQPTSAVSTQGGKGLEVAARSGSNQFTAPQAPGIFDKVSGFVKENPLTSLGIAGLGGMALASAMTPEEQAAASMSDYKGPSEEDIQKARFPAGSFTQYAAPKVNVVPTYSPAYPEFYAAHGGELDARVGGHLKGPGTGTSDSIPARLSDGEFVMTAKAVRGAGGGSREAGAKKMYALMHQFEKRA